VAQQTPHPVLIRRPLASIGKPHFKSTGLPVALACHADPAKLSCKASHHPHVLMCVRVKIDFRDCAHEAVQTFRFFLPFFLSFFLSFFAPGDNSWQCPAHLTDTLQHLCKCASASSSSSLIPFSFCFPWSCSGLVSARAHQTRCLRDIASDGVTHLARQILKLATHSAFRTHILQYGA
jgi:hypothetical protein